MCSSDPAPKIIDSVREVSRTGVSKLGNAELFMDLFSFVKILPLSVRSLALDTFESGLYMYNFGGGSGGEGGGIWFLSPGPAVLPRTPTLGACSSTLFKF